MIDSVLVANRGEIAVRILRTCRRLGIRTVAVYSDADAHAMHVGLADNAVCIGRSPAVESYLNADRILAAARQSGATAIHPGYGFLSENAEFAQTVIDAGLIWIGPPPSAMRALGDKARAKALAEANDVPVLEGYHGDGQSADVLCREAERIGYPVLIKASAGGGGRGMRVVDSSEAFTAALEAAKREALAAFGDDRVLLERYVARPRHVEVQVLGDSRGNLIHLGERECSVQRRHQKLIEETPSPAVDTDLRARMGEAALRLARAAGYSNAGTVEFLLDEDDRFAFLEVNARLQVEHPVTEAVTGLDLVELQIRVATGEPLALSQSEVRLSGHALEARVIAEDPLAGWVPSSGSITHFNVPGDARVDTWLQAGTTVSPFYDSLLAKVIAHAPTRAEAIALLADALSRTRIDGVRHNVDLLLTVLETPAFVDGDLHTRFLEEHHVLESVAETPAEVIAAASAIDHFQPSPADPWTGPRAWRMARVEQPVMWVRAGREYPARVSEEPLGYAVAVNGEVVRPLGPERVDVAGTPARVTDDASLRVVVYQDRTYRLTRAQAPSLETTAQAGRHGAAEGGLSAPMPGRIVKIAVAAGQQVGQNEPLLVLEAMKMEHVVEAPHPGVVAELHVKVGDQVPAGAPLLTLE